MLSKIKRCKPDLSQAEQGVADWVLAHPGQARNATLAEVALATGASEPTVIRFCRSIGLKGFREFKLRLVETLSQPSSFIHSDLGPNDSVSDAVIKVMDRSIRAMNDVRSQSSSMPFEEAAETMAKARQLVFAGLGASGDVSRDAKQKFFRLGIPCSAATDSPAILQTAAILGPNDVLIATSHTGRWPDVIAAARLASENGASVVALTDPVSPLADVAHLIFECQTVEDTNVFTPLSSRLAHLVLLDALQVVLALRLGQAAETNLRKSKSALTILF